MQGRLNSVHDVWTYVDITEESKCWPWKQGVDKDGYGSFRVARRNYRAHRAAYIASIGAIPKGLVIDHLCRNPRCCNPTHLEAVTNEENIMRGQGFGALNARKTHCPQGHKLAGDNTYLTSIGGRRCRTCRRVEGQQRYQRKQATQ